MTDYIDREALLKAISKVGGRNYLDKLDEEYTDVVSCAIALELKPNADISVWKCERHKKRLKEMEGKLWSWKSSPALCVAGRSCKSNENGGE